MENSWVSKWVRSAWEGRKLSNHSPRAMLSIVPLTENPVSSHAVPTHLNQFFFLLSFLLRNPGWYLRPVDFYLYFQSKPKPFKQRKEHE